MLANSNTLASRGQLENFTFLVGWNMVKCILWRPIFLFEKQVASQPDFATEFSDTTEKLA